MNKDCKVLGTLSIRGAIDPALIAMMRKMPAGSPHSPSPESEARWAAAASHPDAADLAKAKSFMQGFLAMYDKCRTIDKIVSCIKFFHSVQWK